MVVKIVPNDKANPPGKLADAELHFTDGVLDGLKLIGFAVWERRSGSGRNVTFPARQYSVNGERRSFALLRPIADAASQERVRDLVLQAYAEYEEDSDGGRFVDRSDPGRRHRGGVRPSSPQPNDLDEESFYGGTESGVRTHFNAESASARRFTR